VFRAEDVRLGRSSARRSSSSNAYSCFRIMLRIVSGTSSCISSTGRPKFQIPCSHRMSPDSISN
jgi:hypothetical protein